MESGLKHSRILRLAAALIDLVLFFLLGWAVLGLVEWTQCGDGLRRVISLSPVVLLVLREFYGPGRILMGLALTDIETGAAPLPVKRCMRSLPNTLPVALFFFMAWNIDLFPVVRNAPINLFMGAVLGALLYVIVQLAFLMLRKSGRSLSDNLAGTVLVRRRPVPLWAGLAVIAVTGSLIGCFFYIYNQ